VTDTQEVAAFFEMFLDFGVEHREEANELSVKAGVYFYTGEGFVGGVTELCLGNVSVAHKVHDTGGASSDDSQHGFAVEAFDGRRFVFEEIALSVALLALDEFWYLRHFGQDGLGGGGCGGFLHFGPLLLYVRGLTISEIAQHGTVQ
jgi:hypothetical protein